MTPLLAKGSKCPASRIQLEAPVLADEVLAERVVGLFRDQFEAGRLVDAAGRGEDVVGPQGQLAVAVGAGETNTLVDEPVADAEAARRGLDIEEAQAACAAPWNGPNRVMCRAPRPP